MTQAPPTKKSSRSSIGARFGAAAARALTKTPKVVLSTLLGPTPVRDGRVLDHQVQLVLRLVRAAGIKSVQAGSVAAARADLDRGAHLLAAPTPDLASVVDVSLPGPAGPIPCRVFRPHGLASPAPTLVFFHGGGWVVGSLDSHDAPCRAVAAAASCCVISVGYRLAPEHPFPAAPTDAVAAFREIARDARRLGIHPERIAVGGDSAGGNLAAIVARETRHDPVRPCLQLLIYPVVDATMCSRSYESCGDGFLLERASMQWFFSHYLGTGIDRKDPRVSPLYADDVAGQPPAFVLTAGFDPLRDEGDAYAAKLRGGAGIVEHRTYASLIHGFFNMAGAVEAAQAPFGDIVTALRRAFSATGGARP